MLRRIAPTLAILVLFLIGRNVHGFHVKHARLDRSRGKVAFYNDFRPGPRLVSNRFPTYIGSTKPNAETSTTLGTLSIEDLDAALKKCSTGTQVRKVLTETLNTRRQLGATPSLYNSLSIPIGASNRGISDGDLAIQTRLVNKKYRIMDLIELSGDRDSDRASLSVVVIFVVSTVAAVLVNQELAAVPWWPETLRFVFVFMLCFAPLAWVGYGIRNAESLQGTLVQLQGRLFPSYRRRMLQHEAGHFLLGHLLGWPIQGYVVDTAIRDSVAFYPLADVDVGTERASLLGFDQRAKRRADSESYEVVPNVDVPYFSKEGRGRVDLESQSVFRQAKNYTNIPMLQLEARNDPTNAWPYRGFSDALIDQLTVISVAGVCAEIIAMGNAEGGRADFGQLQQLFDASQEGLSEKDRENRIRFALGFTMSVLRRHLGALDALATVMDRGGSIAECIAAIELCDNVSGQNDVAGGDYERQRREAYQTQGLLGVLERSFLGSDRSIDTLEDSLVEGKGGGARKQVERLTGDDPFYLAIAVAVLFFLWASSGGLSLH